MQPLADKLRPQSLDDIVGQSHIIGEGKIINKLIENNTMNSIILYGPPGTGKSSLSNIIAKSLNKKHVKLNAVNCGVKEIKEVINSATRDLFYDGVILQLEEVQAMNKKQQQSLLEVIEDGRVTLITSTTENPYFTIFKAILSRSVILEFKQLKSEDILIGLENAIDKLKAIYPSKNIAFESEALEVIANSSNGDMRNAINILSLLFNFSLNKDSDDVNLTVNNLKLCNVSTIMNYDQGDTYYSTLSAYHKSLRGSDPSASVHYLARLVKAGDIQSIARRLLCVAAEDVGICNPQAMVITQSCVSAALQLGLPEARLPLSMATIYLALSPKSFSNTNAIDSAIRDLETIDTGDIPIHLKDAHYSGAKDLGRGIDYKFPHDYPNNYVEQQYLPDKIKDKIYYIPGDNKYENAFKDYWERIKK